MREFAVRDRVAVPHCLVEAPQNSAPMTGCVAPIQRNSEPATFTVEVFGELSKNLRRPMGFGNNGLRAFISELVAGCPRDAGEAISRDNNSYKSDR